MTRGSSFDNSRFDTSLDLSHQFDVAMRLVASTGYSVDFSEGNRESSIFFSSASTIRPEEVWYVVNSTSNITSPYSGLGLLRYRSRIVIVRTSGVRTSCVKMTLTNSALLLLISGVFGRVPSSSNARTRL